MSDYYDRLRDADDPYRSGTGVEDYEKSDRELYARSGRPWLLWALALIVGALALLALAKGLITW